MSVVARSRLRLGTLGFYGGFMVVELGGVLVSILTTRV